MNNRIKLKSSLTLLAAIAIGWLFSVPAYAQQADRNIAKYNLEQSVGLKGYDPVAVFPEGGSVAQMGNPVISLKYEGVTYHFASEDNKLLFLGDPLKYEPTYGGWCAYAMARGAIVDISPEHFTINGRRAHYFISSRAKRSFDRDVAADEKRADAKWLEVSGEGPRM